MANTTLANYPESQPTVFEPTNSQYSLFYWIVLNKLNPDQDAAVIQACKDIQKTVQRVDDPWGLTVGIGFSKDMLHRIQKKTKSKFAEEAVKELDKYLKFPKAPGTAKDQTEPFEEYKHGDIFVHAKANHVGTLFEFKEIFFNTLPPGCVNVNATQIVRGFTYQHHRDISGFIDGIANPQTVEQRKNIAVVPQTGGSFVLTQKWIHKMDIIRDQTRVGDIEDWIGRRQLNGKEITDMNPNAHVALMRGGLGIVRQSMPFTERNPNNDDQSGLFFIAYAKSLENFDQLLTRMVNGTNGQGDFLLMMSINTMGKYWYFPGVEELKNL